MPAFWVAHNLKKCPEHFSKCCNSRYIEACLRRPQECSLENKEKKITLELLDFFTTTEQEKHHWTSMLILHYVYTMKWSQVAQSCPTLCDPMDCSNQASPSMGLDLDLNPRVKVKTLLLLYLLFGKQLHGKLGWFFPLDFTWEWPFFFILKRAGLALLYWCHQCQYFLGSQEDSYSLQLIQHGLELPLSQPQISPVYFMYQFV